MLHAPLRPRVSEQDFFSQIRSAVDEDNFFDLLFALQADRLDKQRSISPWELSGDEMRAKSPGKSSGKSPVPPDNKKRQSKGMNAAAVDQPRPGRVSAVPSPQDLRRPSELPAITSLPFYAGEMDRKEAEDVLEHYPEGTYLVRSSAKGLVFTIRWSKSGLGFCTHVLIETFFGEHNEQRYRFCALDSFPNATALVWYYVERADTFKERFWTAAISAPPPFVPYSPGRSAEAGPARSPARVPRSSMPLPALPTEARPSVSVEAFQPSSGFLASLTALDNIQPTPPPRPSIRATPRTSLAGYGDSDQFPTTPRYVPHNPARPSDYGTHPLPVTSEIAKENEGYCYEMPVAISSEDTY
eukprot:m.32433 g.32433  ORF g.32433 m.32433 type:complete len:356 (-) comp5002_c0_seq1:123-1190(-)